MAVYDPTDSRHRQDADPNQNRRVELTPTEARQGALGRPVLMVLVVGLVLAMLAWGAAEMFGTAIDTQTPADSTQVTTPATEPASENEAIINDNPPVGDQRQTEPALVDPQPTTNQ